jgi:hypothetical protein
VLGRPRFSDGDRNKLRIALDKGGSWHAISVETRIPYATVKKHARAMGYKPAQRLGKPTVATTREVRTNYSGLPTLHEVPAQLLSSRNDGPEP